MYVTDKISYVRTKTCAYVFLIGVCQFYLFPTLTHMQLKVYVTHKFTTFRLRNRHVNYSTQALTMHFLNNNPFVAVWNTLQQIIVIINTSFLILLKRRIFCFKIFLKKCSNFQNLKQTTKLWVQWSFLLILYLFVTDLFATSCFN